MECAGSKYAGWRMLSVRYTSKQIEFSMAYQDTKSAFVHRVLIDQPSWFEERPVASKI